MKHKVLYVIWSLGLGGAEQVVINQVKRLDKEKYEPLVCCLNEEGVFADELKKLGISVLALNKRPGMDLRVVPKLINILKSNDIDIIHTHLWGASFWGRIAAYFAGTGVVVVTEHNVDVWKRFHHKFVDRVLAKVTDKVVVVSNKVKDFYRQEVGLPESILHVVYNGVEPSSKCIDEGVLGSVREEFGLDPTKPTLVNVGRLVPAKANHVFLEALRILEEKKVPFNALVIGDGPLKVQLLETYSDLVVKKLVVFTGLRKDVSRLLDVADVSVLSSTREGFSIVVLESMAKGIPFVATNVGGNDEQIIEGVTGFLVKKNDPAALAFALEKILSNETLREAMGESALKRIHEEFSLESMNSKIELLYEDLLSKAK